MNFQKFETFIRALEVRQRALEQVLQRTRHVRGQRQRLDTLTLIVFALNHVQPTSHVPLATVSVKQGVAIVSGMNHLFSL